MKKLLVILAVILMIAGCSKNAENTVSDADTVLFEVNGVKYTKAELFKSLSAADYSDYVLSDMKMKLADKENIDMTEINEAAQDYYEYIAAYGEYYVTYYGGEEAIKDSYKSYMIIAEIEKDYVKKNLDDYKTSYNPFKAQIVNFNDEETANKFLELLDEGSTFEMAAAELGYESDCSETLYTERSDNLTTEVKTYCSNANSAGLSGVITSSYTGTDEDGNSVLLPTYYVVNMTETDINNLADEFAEYMVNNAYVDENTCLNMTFKNHEINIYDQKVYDSLTSTFEALEIK